MNKRVPEQEIEWIIDSPTTVKIDRRPNRLRTGLAAGAAVIGIAAAIVLPHLSSDDKLVPKPAPTEVSKPAPEPTDSTEQKQYDNYENQILQNQVNTYVSSQLLRGRSESLPIFDGIAVITFATGGKMGISHPIVVTDLQVGISSPTSVDGVPTKPLAVIGINDDADNQGGLLGIYLATEPGISIEYINREGQSVQELDVAGFGTSPGVLYSSKLVISENGDYQYAINTPDNTRVGDKYWIES